MAQPPPPPQAYRPSHLGPPEQPHHPSLTTHEPAQPTAGAPKDANKPAPPPSNKDEQANKGPKAPARQTQHSKELINAFRPLKHFLTVIGQMPFVVKEKSDGTYSFKFYKFSYQFVIYSIFFFLSNGLFLLINFGILTFIMDAAFSYNNPKHTVIVKDKTTGIKETWKWERYIIRHEMVSMIVIWSWLSVACVGSLYIVINSKYYVHYMNYFNRVVQIMDMDMTSNVSAYLFKNNMLSLIVAVVLAISYFGVVVDLTAVANTASVVSNFIFRVFAIEIETDTYFKSYFHILGLLIMIYALFASRANVVQFLFFSQLLKNGSKIWNQRLQKVLTHQTAEDEDDQFNRRLEPRLIYKDHLMIVQLYQMTENVFGSILFAYYSLTIISVVMELYQLATLQGFGTDQQVLTGTGDAEEKQNLIRDRMAEGSEEGGVYEKEILSTILISLLLLAQNVYFCYRTTVDAAKAYEYAMEGFNILRRHGLMYCKNKTDRNFVLSLYFSFAKNNPLQLSAAGYFAVNKVLLVTMSSTIVNWAISIYQTKVDQWK